MDVLKLDKLFVDGLGGAGRSRLLTRGILDLARALGKLVVAEGIEHAEQAERLQELGCTLGQGFLFSQPVGADVIEARLKEGAAEAGSAPSASATRRSRYWPYSLLRIPSPRRRTSSGVT